ncbi:uncharacterized protein LOC131625648 [Vicia villosa]|uniref:uncharacterized protein LOC131625648 n=1 Tax=Vicia villosa TaxID=3911 RepID=UPI00273ACCB7|nr:uncharacterized protein LOC131625648 [Vicia villosa]
MADWSQLPKDLLQLISQKLNSDFYILRFRSVCSTWRLSIPKLYNDIMFLIKPPVTPNEQTLRPWLVRISPTSTGKFNLCHPLLRDSLNIPSDPPMLDFNQLSVFDVGQIYILGILFPNSSSTSYSHYGCCVVRFEGEQIPNIVTYDSDSMGMVMFRCGGDGSTKIPNVAPYYRGMCVFKGRPCLTEITGRTVMIESDLSVHLVAEPVFGDDAYVTGIYIMVENESDLLLVHKYTEDYDIDDELVMFDVFRLDQREKKWLKLENLGDMVLFLGQGCSLAISASDLGINGGNCVIYCSYLRCKMRIFPLDQHRTFPLSDYPDYLKLFWPPPEWIVSVDLSVDLVAESVFGGDIDGDVKIMVENVSELFLVHKYLEDYDYDADDYCKDELVRIDVFRLDQKEKKWLKLENLGDKVLFLGKSYSFTASASDLGFDNGNFVIYRNDNDNLSGDCELSVFLMDQQRTFELSDYRDYIKLFWPFPDWIFIKKDCPKKGNKGDYVQIVISSDDDGYESARALVLSWSESVPLKLPLFFEQEKLYKYSIFLIKSPVTSNQQTLRHWLIRISPTSSEKFNLWHPLLRDSLNIPSDPHVLDFSQLSVFNIEQIYIQGLLFPNSFITSLSYHGRSLVTFEGEHNLNILTQDNNSWSMVMFRCGGDGLTKIPNVAPYYQGMCIFKGRPCLTDNTGRTVMIGSDLSLHLAAEPGFRGNINGEIYIMVENESELLLVHKYEVYYDCEDDYDDDEFLRFEVFRLDQREKKWVKLENLGDKVLFLGPGYSFAISASDLGLDNGNSVIYCSYDRNNEIRVFPLDQQQTFPLSDYPDYVKLFWPQSKLFALKFSNVIVIDSVLNWVYYL